MAEVPLQVTFKPSGRTGNGILTAMLGGEAVYTARMDITCPEERMEFAKVVCEGRPGIDLSDLSRVLEAQAAECAGGDSDDAPEKATQAQALIELMEDTELFHDSDNNAYATLIVSAGGEHRETHSINNRSFRMWLQREFYRIHGKPPGAQALQDAIGVLSSKACFDGPELPVAIRVAEQDGAIWLDLGNERWQAVKVTADGWQVVDTPQVRFIRRPGMRPLPVPVAGGCIELLRPLINAADKATWCLIVSWLFGALRPTGPYPILAVNGEQGSAKTTLCKMLRGLIDPNESDLRAAPRDDRDLMIAATNSWMVGYDNLSYIRPDLSDAVCRLATGGGFATRALYSNDEEKLFNACRPIMFNGIEELATRPDLLERAIVLNLPSIPEGDRKSESWLWAQYEQVRPLVLGALLTAVSEAMRNLSNTQLSSHPRMADFAEWVVAAEPALPWQTGSFLAIYAGNRDSANELALEASAIGPVVLALMHDQAAWQGQAKDLLALLETDRYTDHRTRQRQDWPRNPKALSNALRRIAPTIRRLGVQCTFDRREPGGNRRRMIYLERLEIRPSVSSESSPTVPGDAPEGVDRDGGGRYDAANCPVKDAPADAGSGVRDSRDGGAAAEHACLHTADGREVGGL